MFAPVVQSVRTYTLRPRSQDAIAAKQVALALGRFEAAVNNCSAGSHAMQAVVADLTLEFSKSYVWNFLAARFQAGVVPDEAIEQLVRCHLATFEVGLAHLQVCAQTAGFGLTDIDKESARLLRSLDPQIRSKLVSQWSSETSGLHATSNRLLAMEIPEVGCRCLLIDEAFAEPGLQLTSDEVATLLQARIVGMPQSSLLDVLSGSKDFSCGMETVLLARVIGQDGRATTTLDVTKLAQLARMIDDALTESEKNPALRPPLAGFFEQVGEFGRATRIHDELAAIEDRLEEQTALRIVRHPDGSNDALIKAQKDVQLRIAEHYRRGALCCEASAGLPDRLADLGPAATRYFAAAERYLSGGDGASAREQFTAARSALERFATVGDFATIEQVLFVAFATLGRDYEAVSQIGERCATSLGERTLRDVAEAVHTMTATQLDEILWSYGDVNCSAVLAEYARHRRASQMPPAVRLMHRADAQADFDDRTPPDNHP